MSDQRNSEQEFIDKLQTRLRQSEVDIDDTTAARLHQLRRVALDAIPDNNGMPTHGSSVIALPQWQNYLLPLGSVAATVAIAVLVFNLTVLVPEGLDLHQTETLSVMDDMAILTAPDELELYQDLEFYEWLAYDKELDKA